MKRTNVRNFPDNTKIFSEWGRGVKGKLRKTNRMQKMTRSGSFFANQNGENYNRAL